MSILISIKIMFILFIINANCKLLCNEGTNVAPESEYHCSGLLIDKENDKSKENDTFCCLWTYIENVTYTTKTRCSSLSNDQFNDLENYKIKKRAKNVTDIKCVEDQKLYCSNIILDEEIIDDCSKLAISTKKDLKCCKWHFKDSSNQGKVNNYCASINEYEFLTIKSYVFYKNAHPDQRYDELTIDCRHFFLKMKYILILTIIIFLIF